MRSARTYLVLAGSGLLATCGGDASSPVVPVPTELRLDASSLDFTYIGEREVMSATVLDQEGAPIGGVTVTWSSDDPAVASVTAQGEVHAEGNGATVVRARVGSVEAELPVSVSQGVASVEIALDSIVLADVGDSMVVAAVASDEGGTPLGPLVVSWVVRDTGVALVAPSGAVTAVGTGSTWVIASAGGLSDSLSVRVEPELVIFAIGSLPVEGEVVSEVSLAGRVEDLLGAGYGGATVFWSTGAGSGSIISEQSTTTDQTGTTGAVWQLGEVAGTQRAFAQIETRGRTEVVEFLANALAGPAVSANLVADSVLLSARGETAFLAPALLDSFDNEALAAGVTWTASDSTIVAVSADGLVTGGQEGATWVRAWVDGAPSDSILVTVQHRGAITITFDDGFRSVYENAWPVLQEYGYAANVAVNPVPVDQSWPDYMTRAMLDEVHSAGWSIVSHTLQHDSLPSLSPGELDYDLRATQQWILDAGYNGANVFVAPYHAYGPAEREAVSVYYEASRGTSSDIVSPDSLVAWRPDNPFELTGREADLLPYTTPTGRGVLQALLQRTVDEGVFLDVFFHRVPPENVADFRAMLDVFEGFRDRVLPYHELFPRFARTVE